MAEMRHPSRGPGGEPATCSVSDSTIGGFPMISLTSPLT
jgi:hypothetical protein